MSSAIINIPKCSAHNVSMVLYEPKTKEQNFVGTLYHCPFCGNSVLFTSNELQSFLSAIQFTI